MLRTLPIAQVIKCTELVSICECQVLRWLIHVWGKRTYWLLSYVFLMKPSKFKKRLETEIINCPAHAVINYLTCFWTSLQYMMIIWFRHFCLLCMINIFSIVLGMMSDCIPKQNYLKFTRSFHRYRLNLTACFHLDGMREQQDPLLRCHCKVLIAHKTSNTCRIKESKYWTRGCLVFANAFRHMGFYQG